MPRPRKYESLHGRQEAYHKTEKGKLSLGKYQASEKARAAKRRWWQEHRGVEPVNMRQQFIDTYGQPDTALASLNDRERQIITLYFGLSDGNTHTLEDIGMQVGISKQRVSQLKSAALKKIPS